ncbi:type II toxin-antitoxin system RelE/ParE family toxin [Tychonema sp. BBK16]|uniref:type II toxin-antitoxin system RelE family toxin n=1 Tax=Tychonema sp. BBK16 TaxID=2699888 RepID=UPI001F23F3DC|nr:type II toxin-antitoxin system RelE/ParE family toxin [Tychonema sp. BBK16]MCF6375072.1 type II toxin-antitoxin system RelE/ParE family toxin [Tychonema sp. BBK16]
MSDMPVQLKFTALFKRRLKGLAKKYRQIQTDIQPVLDQIIQGNFIGDQITGTQYIVYKVRAKNSDAQVGKSGGYRLIYQVESSTQVVLHLIYSKSEQANVSAEEILIAIAQYQADQGD